MTADSVQAEQVRSVRYCSIFILGATALGLFAHATRGEVFPKPLFSDPNYHGSCDPEVFYDREADEWLIFYTGRRALRAAGGVAAGCPIGVARSKDLHEWKFAGYCRFDGHDDVPDAEHTYWAPAVVRHGDSLHMFVTYRGTSEGFWGGEPEGIRHYVADPKSPLDWQYADLAVAGPEAIDAGLIRLPGRWRLYYRDLSPRTPKGVTTYVAESTDLMTWNTLGPAVGDVNDRRVTGYGYQEAPFPFQWRGQTWLLTDPAGPPIAAYRLDADGAWRHAGVLLDVPGTHATDRSFGRHPSVAVLGDRALVFYHCEPHRDYSKPYPEQPIANRRCYLQVGELHEESGMLSVSRGLITLTGQESVPESELP
ncbi:Glycosyl hydrolases family 43 [Pirellulimonas nuda]|uniref:Glycosyl hydrolases family 43 n=1 Tax=Pirellulimonas nuda TaxID=2528009 RepID=A0A518DDR6_9BACT|nr:family 43 glycosylhydrolase [Pirellulimonas nuda]QDU89620.1 Glycosyl hydrolases family 43 [Pirellulimonas nuda]